MKYLTQKILVVAAFGAHLAPTITHAEILAAVNYESKAEDSIRTLQQGERVQDRREGVAVVDVDPESENFGNWLFHIPLPADLIGHHLFYNNDRTKLYLTALGRSELRIFDLITRALARKGGPSARVQGAGGYGVLVRQHHLVAYVLGVIQRNCGRRRNG